MKDPVILATKLRPPGLKPNSLCRERLLRLLKNNLEKKLILIAADAGYGKTTLLVQTLREARLPGVFYELDRGDSDFPVFFAYLVHGLEELEPELIPRTRGLMERRREVGSNLELAMGTLINELSEKRKEELFFLFDDYQTLDEDSPVHQALDYFIAHLPDAAHVVIVSRTVPPLPNLAKWRAKRDLFELTREDLAFTDEEMKSLLRVVYKRDSSEEELKQVREQTEGWITGIQLILQSADKKGRTIQETLAGYLEANHPLFEYFANEVLNNEPPGVQEFLRQSALLDLLSPEACDDILERTDSAGLLAALEKRHLFVTRTGHRQYKYHPMFREFLLGHYGEGRERDALHLRAAEHFRREGQVEQAIEHYLHAGRPEKAGKVIVQTAEDMEEQSRYTTMARWLQHIPGDVLDGQPRLLMLQGTVYQEQGRLEEAQEKFLRAESLLRQVGPKRKDHALALVRTRLEQGRLAWQRGDYSRGLAALGKALKASPAREKRLTGDILNLMGLVWGDLGDRKKARRYLLRAQGAVRNVPGATNQAVMIEANLATLLLEQGEARQAWEVFGPLLDRIGGTYFLEVGIQFANAALAAMILGRLDRAGRALEQGWTLCRPYEDPRSKAALHLRFGALHMEDGQWEAAEEHLQKALEDARALQWSSQEVVVQRELGRLCRYRGDLGSAQKHLDIARLQLGGEASFLGAYLLSEIGLLQAARGEFEEAGRTVRSSLRLARRFGGSTNELRARLLGAEVCWARGGKKEAARWFLGAVRLAMHKEYRGILASELRHNPGLAALARRMAKRPTEGEYLCGIVEESKVGEDRAFLCAQLFGPLQISLSGGGTIPLKWGSRRVASLCAYLLQNRDRVCEREELMEAFWPKSTREQAERNLHTTISRLKKALATGLKLAGERTWAGTPLVVREEGGYRLAPGLRFRLDAEEFLAGWQEARSLEREGKADDCHRSFERCAELYRDRFLPNLTERWCEERREEYEKIYLSCLKRLAACRMGRKDYEEAISFYRSYLAKEPYSEEVHREYWKALKAVGLKSDIHRDYKGLQRALRKDFGEEPGRETEEAYREAIFS